MISKSRSMIFPEKIIPGNQIFNETRIIRNERTIKDRVNIPSKDFDIYLENHPIISMRDAQEMTINGNITVNGEIKSGTGEISEDLHTKNMVITNELVGSKAYLADELYVNNKLTTTNLESETLETSEVSTNSIRSDGNLNISNPIGCITRTGNMQLGVNHQGIAVLEPNDIKSAKVFIARTNVLLNADTSCDGIEIVIYNDNTGSILVRDEISIIRKLESGKSCRIIYLDGVNKWV